MGEIAALADRVGRVTDSDAREWLCRFRKDPEAVRVCAEVLRRDICAQVTYFSCQTLAYRSKYQDIDISVIHAGVDAYKKCASAGATLMLPQIALFLVRGCARLGTLEHLHDILPPSGQTPLPVIQVLAEELTNDQFPLTSTKRSAILMQYAKVVPQLGNWLRDQEPTDNILEVICAWIKGCREMESWLPIVGSLPVLCHVLSPTPPAVTETNAFILLELMEEVLEFSPCPEQYVAALASSLLKAPADPLARCLYLVFCRPWLTASVPQAIDAALSLLAERGPSIAVLDALRELEDNLNIKDKAKLFPPLLESILRCVAPPVDREIRTLCSTMLARFMEENPSLRDVCAKKACQLRTQCQRWQDVDLLFWLQTQIERLVREDWDALFDVERIAGKEHVHMRMTICEYLATQPSTPNAIAFVHSCAPYCDNVDLMEEVAHCIDCIDDMAEPHTSVPLILDSTLPFALRARLATSLPTGEWLNEVIDRQAQHTDWARLALFGLRNNLELLEKQWSLWEDGVRHNLDEALSCISIALAPLRRQPERAYPLLAKALPLLLAGGHMSIIANLGRIFVPSKHSPLIALFISCAVGAHGQGDPERCAAWFELLAILGKHGHQCDAQVIVDNMLPLAKVVCWALQALKWSPVNEVVAHAVLCICEQEVVCEPNVSSALATAICQWETLGPCLRERAQRIPDIPEKAPFLDVVENWRQYGPELSEVLLQAVSRFQRQLAALREDL